MITAPENRRPSRGCRSVTSNYHITASISRIIWSRHRNVQQFILYLPFHSHGQVDLRERRNFSLQGFFILRILSRLYLFLEFKIFIYHTINSVPLSKQYLSFKLVVGFIVGWDIVSLVVQFVLMQRLFQARVFYQLLVFDFLIVCLLFFYKSENSSGLSFLRLKSQ